MAKTKIQPYGTITKWKFKIVAEKKYSYGNSEKIANRKDVEEFLFAHMGNSCIEYVTILALDSSNKIIGTQTSEGDVNQCVVYPKNVFRFLLLCGAASFILAHNHPAGSTNPSEADWKITERLCQVGLGLELPMHDHIIIGDKALSMRECARWPRY